MKKIITTALAAAMALTAGAVFAAPVEFDSQIKTQYRSNTKDTVADTQGGIFSFRLNAKTALDKNVDLFARFAAQSLSGDKIGADFDQNKYGNNGLVTLDQYGIIFKGKDFKYKLGRQGVSITPTALLYSSESYIGENMSFLDGLVVDGKSGVTSLQFVAGKSDQTTKDKVYSLHGSYSPAKKWTVGGTIAKSNPNAGSDKTYWGTDVQYATGKANFVADYLRSDADTNNDALVLGVSYAFDSKNTLSAYSHNTGSKSNIATDWDNGQKGAYYIYNHTFDKTTSLNLLYRSNIATESIAKDNTSFRATVAYKF
ncbi:hypothetical protein [Pelosinus sp. UFO1]|uniref:hypothetical protein n=1 Tax=Pelosinus sp. UFO1 TaxID=484770 RepID=UPI0004D0B734|nr:hypothetical protein [Pelosinus sp. UFO1]AIF51973.1 hypothetical protein UFO1_2426 [Pelosinus sp. UFO1]